MKRSRQFLQQLKHCQYIQQQQRHPTIYFSSHSKTNTTSNYNNYQCDHYEIPRYEYKLSYNDFNSTKRKLNPIDTMKEIQPVGHYRFSGTIPLKSNEQHRKNNQRLKRKRNLGEMVETLQAQIPNILTQQISSDLLSRNIILRILPNQFPNLPVLKGWVIATTTLKTLTLVLTSFYLNPKTKLHVSKIQIVEPSDSSTLGQNDLLDLSLGTSAVELSSLENVNRQFLSRR
ncbi:unnamed protein product [Ambrosiozyma monospora]|uniref:Unnamed protein product n=1 Tax=Ambrosiozyma monospora TaxID=43982 RepID=A0ACB5T3E5_AMBMO|nr:unnamed protein product [Ambrosiozyma monospora]